MKSLKKAPLHIGILFLFTSAIIAQDNQDTTAHYMSKFKEDLQYLVNSKPYKGAAITVYKDGQYWSTDYGIKTEGVPADHEDRFIFRSFTKTLLATVILQLQEVDSLDIDDRYIEYIEPVTNVDTTLTLRELLSMKANVCEFVGNTWEIIDQDPTAVHDVRDILERTIPAGPCNAEKAVVYTNTNYMVLGLVMEEVLGETGEDIFYYRFYKRTKSPFLGLHPWAYWGGGFELAPIDIDPNTLNGVWTDNNGNPSDQFGKSLNAVLTAQKYAGSVVGTTEQMLRILNAILTPGLLLSQESLDEMQNIENNYGLGLMGYDLIDEENNLIRMVGHFGAGLNSTATFSIPEYDFAISIALNLTPSTNAFNDGINNLIYNFSYLFNCVEGGGCTNIAAPDSVKGIASEITLNKYPLSTINPHGFIVEYENWDGETDTLTYAFSNDLNVVDSEGKEIDIESLISSNHNVTVYWESINSTRYLLAKSIILDGVLTTAEKNSEIAESFNLHQNYPNPFNPSTNISFSLPKASLVELKVYNMLGQEVATLADGRMSSGLHSVNFDATQLSSGIYVYRLISEGQSITKKMMLIK